jgi:hypothetical protein
MGQMMVWDNVTNMEERNTIIHKTKHKKKHALNIFC